MNILDNFQEIKKLDKSNVLGSVQQLGQQLKQTREELENVEVPKEYRQIENIVINGMGGSRLGARVAQKLFEKDLGIPLIPVGNYQLPAFVNKKTLLILSSYSGNTEEILASAKGAFKKGAKVMILSQNGQLTKIAKKRKLPGYYGFTPKHNPSDQPRMSIGYQILGIILLLSKCGLLHLSNQRISNLERLLEKMVKKYNLEVKTDENKAKELALLFKNKIPILIGAEFLMGALHVWRNQMNENAKHFSVYFEIPELNHHLLEGLKFPANNPDNLLFFFVESTLYHSRNQQRMKITKKVLDKYSIKYQTLKLTGRNRIEQVFETIQLGGFVGFYLSMLNKIDPAPIPWVDYFKAELKKIYKS